MENTNTLGIWMDHTEAQLIDLQSTEQSYKMECEFTFEAKEEALTRSEKLMHNKRQQQQEQFYNKIGKAVLAYDHVLLFGPTNAKVELYNHLEKDLHFTGKEIDIESADYMSDNHRVAFVKAYFKQ